QTLGAGQTVSTSRQITLIGGSFGQVNVCAKITEHRGVAAGNEIDSSNWEDCQLQTYSDVSSTGSFRLLSPVNKSRLEANHLVIDIEDAPISANQTVNINLYNLNGQVIYNSAIASNDHQIYTRHFIPAIPQGLYILELNFDGHSPMRKKLNAFKH
ncbi:MAG: T9SS type A sorting domain-containing protein, partial [Cryomorphaceae bacterium]|nr:T9SS type A sorting domain-containing protein [Cryomorphaceae bacterium]